MNFANSSKSRCAQPQSDASDPDQLLVQAVRLGSASAFSELHALYERRVYRTIRSITKNKEDAEDATQETFLSAFRAIGTFEGRSNFSAWLTRIAINSALMVLRKRKRSPELSLELSCEGLGGKDCHAFHDRAADPSQSFEHDQLRSRLISSIKRLKPRLRIVVEEQINQQSSAKEVAAKLQISEAAVKSRLHRARIQLRVSPRHRPSRGQAY
jgi:RNA polymerase sigma-70 factor (ECF subfamily)